MPGEGGSVEAGAEVRVPKVARDAAAFLLAVERATPEAPASLDYAEGMSGSFVEALGAHFKQAVGLYEEYNGCMLDSKGVSLDPHNVNLPNVLKLAHAIRSNTKLLLPHFRSRAVVLGALQVTAAGAEVVHKPAGLAAHVGPKSINGLVYQASEFAQSVYGRSVANRIRGDMNKLPDWRLGYPGQLVDIYLGFLRSRLVASDIDATLRLEDGLRTKVQDVISQFSPKHQLLDAHSLVGRPDQRVAREAYQSHIDAFAQTLNYPAPPRALATSLFIDIDAAMRSALNAEKAARKKGYSPSDALRLVFQKSGVIGRNTERTNESLLRTNVKFYNWEGPPESAELTIGFPRVPQEHSKGETDEAIQRRHNHSGSCAARNPLPLQPGGETHTNVQALVEGVFELIGVRPPLLHEVDGKPYLDLPASTITYGLYVRAVNEAA